LDVKLGVEDRRKLATAGVLMALAALLIGHWIFGSQSSALANAGSGTASPTVPARPAAKTKPSKFNPLDPTLQLAQLELTEHEVYEGSGRNIFQSLGEDPPQKTQTAAPKPKTGPTTILVTAAAPPIGLKFFGIASTPNSPRKVCLTQDGDVFIGTEGDIIDRRYKILHINSNTVELEDLLENKQYTLALQQ
jgi:hypothetical protein